MKLMVLNLPRHMRESDLAELFKKYGDMKAELLMKSRSRIPLLTY